MPQWPPCHHSGGHAHLFYPPTYLPEANRQEREQRALAICAQCPLIEACDRHANRFAWPDGFVIAGRVINNPNMEAREMPKELALVDYTPVVEPIPERKFKRPLGAVAMFPPETIALLVSNPGVAIRVMTNATPGPLVNRSKHLRDGVYGFVFSTAGPRLIEEGPDAGKYGLWAFYPLPTDEPQYAPAPAVSEQREAS